MYNFPQHILKAAQGIQHKASAEINQWMKAQIEKKIDPNEMVAAMVRGGFPQESASMLVALAMSGNYIGKTVDERIVQRVGPNEQVAEHAVHHYANGGDRQVRKLMSMGSLDVVLYEDFLSEEEMEHIKTQAEPKLQRSMVVGQNFQSVPSEVRTSDGAFLDVGLDPIISRIEKRIENITGIKVEHGEGLQVLRYAHTQEYKPHFDFFEPSNDQERHMMQMMGNRVGTLILYLSDVEEGGSTYFPQLKLAIHPKKGSAVWFGYMGKDGVLDMRSEHAGMPIIKGEKWIATKWLRERPFQKMNPHQPMMGGQPMVIPFPKRA